MEDSLGLLKVVGEEPNTWVLILVVMEDSLGQPKKGAK